MKLDEIQQALREADLDGWLFCDFHQRDPLAYRILGLDASGMATRRWFYFVPARGEPVKLAHRVEPTKLAGLPGRQEHYRSWTELHERLKDMVGASARVAMQYSPLNHIPYVSVVDGGTIELIRSLGPEIVSSADLVQRFEAVLDEAALDSHRRAGDAVQRIKDDAFALAGQALERGERITELDLHEFILRRFDEAGLTNDGDGPIVGFNEHPADPHFHAAAETAYTLKRGDTILIDLWARRREPPGIYYDITWCGYAGTEPPSLYREIFDVVRRARDTAHELVTQRFSEGRPCRGCELDRAARRVVEDAGFGEAFLHRTGHSIGREVHGNGANIDDLETRDERVLLPGTVFSIEPGIYLAGRMAVRLEIDVILTPAGRAEVHGPIQQEIVLVG